ncbi:zinc finger CCCH domain-containing protein 49-like protein, partial [Tanacetum coccineum]
QKQIRISARSALGPSQSSGGDLAEMQDTRKVRDTALNINSNDAIPKSDVNREYFAEEHDRTEPVGGISATNYVISTGDTVTGCLGDINNFLKKGKLEQVVAIVKSLMAHRISRDVEADGRERSDFPIVCEQKQILISARSALGPSQSSGGDLAEMQDTRKVRDTALNINSNDAIPKSDANREYFAEEHDRRARAGLDYQSSFGKAQPNDTIMKLQRTTPYYKRNQARICSFFIRGECKRGVECAYRHEMPVTGELSQQNIKDRYYGVNDPVALKLLNKAGDMQSRG